MNNGMKKQSFNRSFWILLWCFLSGISVIAFADSKMTLQVVEVAERLYDGGPAIAVIFSEKLDPKKRYDSYFQVQDKQTTIAGSWILSDNQQVLYFPHLQPAQRYKVSIHQGIQAASGQSLSQSKEYAIKTQPIKPAVGFASQGSVLPERLTAGLPIMSVNVAEVDIEFLKVKAHKLAAVVQRMARRSALSHYDLDNLHPYLESVYMARFNTHGTPNKRSISHIPVEEMEPLQAPGFYVAVLRQPGRFTYQQQTTFFFVSDIGLHIRRFADHLEMISSSLRTGHALAAVNIAVHDAQGNVLTETTSDATGRANLSVVKGTPVLVTASQGNHISFVYLKQAALDLSAFAVKGRRHRALDVFLYGPRDLYRPGESVDLSALLRTGDGEVAPALPLNARIKRADGREFTRFTWHSATQGYYSHQFTLPGDAPTGQWSVEVRTDPNAHEPIQVYPFKVEEFLPERMKLSFATAQQSLKSEEHFELQINGEYLYGAPTAGNRVQTSVNLRREVHPEANLVAFYFGNPDDDMKNSRRELADGVMDKNGQFSLNFIPMQGVITSPMRVTVIANLFETGGRPVTRRLSRTLWPASHLIGVRPLFAEHRAEPNGNARFEIVKVNDQGQRLAAQDLDVQMIRESRDYYWEYDEHRGWHWNYSQTNYPIYRQDINLTAGDVAEIMVPVEYGEYSLQVFDPDTQLTSKYRFTAGGSYGPDQAVAARPDSVQINLDKATYQVGDVAKVHILPPHEGDAIIRVESDRPLWSLRTPIPAEGKTIEIPINAAWKRHDIYVSAMVLRGADSQQKISPNRALGIVYLPLDRESRRLVVTLEAPAKIEPERTLTIGVKIDGLTDQQATVTVAAVDVGILNITDFATPNPHDYFFAQRTYNMDLYDLYGQVIEGMEGPRATLRYGGDADSRGLQRSKRADAKVKIISLFSGPVTVNQQGEALVKLPIPDFNGRLRLMAVAFSDNQLGAAEQEILVRAPIVAELATPRFLASGDRSMATLDLHNMSGQAQSLRVEVSTQGPLTLENGATQIDLADGQKTTLRYPLSAGLDLAVATLRVAVSGDQIKLLREWQLAIRPAFPGEFRAQRQMLEPDQHLVIDPALANDLMPNTVEVVLNVASLPPLNLREAFKHLLDYPYGCAEQTTSKVFPLIYADQATIDRFNLKPLSESGRAKRVQHGLTRLAGMQTSQGGFGLWSNTDRESFWLSAYVTHFLLEAKQQGYAVSETMLQNALKRLLRWVQSSRGFSLRETAAENYQFAAKAYAAYVLARLNRAPLGTLRNLYDHHRQHADSALPLMHLGLALKLSGDQRRAEATIIEAMKKQRRRDHYFGDYGSQLRDTAMILYLLNKHAVTVAGAGDLIFQLANQMRQRRYFSTQERNALFLSGLALTDGGKAWQGWLTLGKDKQALGQNNRYQAIFDRQQLNAGISFQSTADFPLYVSATISGYPHQPVLNGDKGVIITRRLLDLKGQAVAQRELQVGELLVVHSTVKLDENRQDMHDGLLVDLLPAGLELENQNLAHAESLQDIKINGVSLQASMENRQIRHLEYRDDRFVAAVAFPRWNSTHLFYLVRAVTPGTYTWSAPTVEDMYRPEIHSIGADTQQLRIVNVTSKPE